MTDDPTDTTSPGDELPIDKANAAPDVCQACGGSGELDGSTCPSCDGSGETITAVGGG